MALSFLYIGFVRLLHLTRLCRSWKRGAGHRDRRASSRGLGATSPDRPASSATVRPSSTGGSEPTSVSGATQTVLRPARNIAAVASRSCPTEVDLSSATTWSTRTCGRDCLVGPSPGEKEPTWGHRRIHGELATMGVRLAPSSVWEILRRHSIERHTSTMWSDVGRVPANSGDNNTGLRLLYCRLGPAPALLRAVFQSRSTRGGSTSATSPSPSRPATSPRNAPTARE